jgi:hypothetical protein
LVYQVEYHIPTCRDGASVVIVVADFWSAGLTDADDGRTTTAVAGELVSASIADDVIAATVVTTVPRRCLLMAGSPSRSLPPFDVFSPDPCTVSRG